MANKTEDKKKVFNFGESPLVKKTEQTVVEGYQRIEDEEQGVGEKPTVAAVQHATVEPVPTATQPTEENKAIQAYIPM